MKKKKSELTVQSHWNGRGYQCKLFGREGVTSGNSGKEGVASTDSLEGKGLPLQTVWKGRGYQFKLCEREGVTIENSLERKGLPVQIIWKGTDYQCKLFGWERVTSANSLEGKGLIKPANALTPSHLT